MGSLANSGSVTINQGATLNLTSQPNGITDVVSGSTLQVYGTLNAGASNGLFKLTSVEGTLVVGDTSQIYSITPTGGALMMTGNGSTVNLDLERGATVSITGNLTNSGRVDTNAQNLSNRLTNALNVSGNFTNSTGAVFQLGDNNNTHDMANITGTLFNNGTGTVVLLPGTVPTAGAVNNASPNFLVENATLNAGSLTNSGTLSEGKPVSVKTPAAQINITTTLDNFGTVHTTGSGLTGGNTLHVTGAFTNESSGVLDLDTNSDTVQVGTISKAGTVNLGDAALTVQSGNSTAGYTQTAGGMLDDTFVTTSLFGVINIIGAAFLDGSLNITVLGGFTPSVGENLIS